MFTLFLLSALFGLFLGVQLWARRREEEDVLGCS